MRRLQALTLAAFTVFLGLATVAPAAHAQNGEAEALNDEGKTLFAEGKYFQAKNKFKQATEIAPLGKYFFNLCFSLNYLENYREAVKACEQVEPNGADEALVEKTDKLLVELRKRVPQTPDPGNGDPNDPGNGDPNDPGNGDPNDPGNGDPNDPGNGDPNDPDNGGNSVTVGAPPGPVKADAFVTGNAPDLLNYRWAAGAEVGLVANLGIGNDDDLELFDAAGLGLKLFANFLLSEQRRFGMQGRIALATFGTGDDNAVGDSLNVFDIGAGAFMHFPIGTNLVVTPLAGLDISLFQASEADSALAGLSFRAEGSVAVLLGKTGQHAVSLTPSLQLYTAATGDSGTDTPESLNLDKGSAAFAVTVGYTMRFQTPFGQTSLITLE